MSAPHKTSAKNMNHAIILAAGQGQRLSSKFDKMLVPICGKPLIYYSLMAFQDHPEIQTVTIVASPENREEIQRIVRDYKFSKVGKITIGGETRQLSLAKGLQALAKIAKKDELVAVHNGANPLPSFDEILECLEKAREHGSCIVGHFITSTIKEVDDQYVIKTHNRQKMFAAQTPQIAKYSLLQKAIQNARKNNLQYTDEASMLEAMGEKVLYIEAHEENFKITTQVDLQKLKTLLGDMSEDFSIGLGQDSHLFDEAEKGLTLGGLYFENAQKLKANSDGDVILHAIFNAISQALGDMSLGFYADKYCEKGVKDSKKYLEIILEKMKKQSFHINSLGLMMECKTPKIDPLVSKMKKSLSEILSISPNKIGITATSGENITIFGAGLGIQCFAIVSLKKG